MNSKSVIFGQKEGYAIEIKPYDLRGKFYLRLWFNGNEIGEFERGGSLDYLMNEYFRYITNRPHLYEPQFDNKNDMEIFQDVALVVFSDLQPEVEKRLNERMNRYSFNFGDYQFNSFSFLVLNLKKENKLKFLIYEMDGKSEPRLHSHTIGADNFLSVYKEFMQYAYKNDLKKHALFFPEGFSYDDIK